MDRPPEYEAPSAYPRGAEACSSLVWLVIAENPQTDDGVIENAWITLRTGIATHPASIIKLVS
jgi:hypothetical protein